MDDLYQEPDCGAHVPHAGICTLCGAEPRWVVPVEPCQHGNYDPHAGHSRMLWDEPCAPDTCDSSYHRYECEGAQLENCE